MDTALNKDACIGQLEDELKIAHDRIEELKRERDAQAKTIADQREVVDTQTS